MPGRPRDVNSNPFPKIVLHFNFHRNLNEYITYKIKYYEKQAYEKKTNSPTIALF